MPLAKKICESEDNIKKYIELSTASNHPAFVNVNGENISLIVDGSELGMTYTRDDFKNIPDGIEGAILVISGEAESFNIIHTYECDYLASDNSRAQPIGTILTRDCEISLSFGGKRYSNIVAENFLLNRHIGVVKIDKTKYGAAAISRPYGIKFGEQTIYSIPHFLSLKSTAKAAAAR